MTPTTRSKLHLAAPPAEAPARPVEPVIVNRLPHESAERFERRRAFIQAMGTAWLGHSQYTFRPIHSTNPEVWQPAHLQWWERVHVAAAMDRAKSKAFIRAARCLAALED